MLAFVFALLGAGVRLVFAVGFAWFVCLFSLVIWFALPFQMWRDHGLFNDHADA